jgi:hypothetical protein
MQTEQEVVYEGTVPARPDVAPEVQTPAPRKHRWLGFAAAGVIVLAIAGGNAATGSNEAPSSSTTVEAPASTTNIGEAASQSAALITEAGTELDLAIAAGDAGDVSGMVGHVRATSAAWSQVSDVWAGIDPYLESTASQVAAHIDRSADYVEAGDYDSAISEIETGTALIQQMNDYLDAGNVGGVQL